MNLSVLHCPSGVGGNPQNLACSERLLGLNSVCISFEEYYLRYPSDEILWKKGTGTFSAEIKRWQLLYRAIRKFDVIHFNSGMPILPFKTHTINNEHRTIYKKLLRSIYNQYSGLIQFRDLALLYRFNKPIFVTYQGDDARQGDFCKKHFKISHADEVDDSYYTPESDTIKRQIIDQFDKYAFKIYSLNPDLLYVLPKRAEFVPYASVDLVKWKAQDISRDRAKRPLVVHAPTHRKVKGTRYITETINRLRQDNVHFDFMLVENMSNAEAKKLYEKADIMIDQVLVGWYGGAAVEFMALAKPVLAYIRNEDLQFIPAQMKDEMPVINTTPTDLYASLKDLIIGKKGDLLELGVRSRNYVERWHNPLKIADRLKTDYEIAWGERDNSRTRHN